MMKAMRERAITAHKKDVDTRLLLPPDDGDEEEGEEVPRGEVPLNNNLKKPIFYHCKLNR